MGKIWDKKTLYYFSLLGELSLLFITNILLFIYLYKRIFVRYIGENGFIFILFIFAGLILGGISVYKLILKK